MIDKMTKNKQWPKMTKSAKMTFFCVNFTS